MDGHGTLLIIRHAASGHGTLLLLILALDLLICLYLGAMWLCHRDEARLRRGRWQDPPVPWWRRLIRKNKKREVM